jgi:hypothetical protein
MNPVRGRVVPVLLAAGVLVGGANLAAYSATGSPLMLGHSNSAAKTTALSSGKGPALSLHSSKKAPSLAVSSSKLVKHLNADTVHGVPAAVVAPKAYQMTLVKAGGHFTNSKIVTATLPPGTYQVAVDGILNPATTPTSAQCIAGDARFLADPTPDVSEIYAVDGEDAITSFGFAANAVGTAVVTKAHAKVFLLCLSSGVVNSVNGVTANFSMVNGTSKLKTKVFVPSPRSPISHLRLGR